MKDEDLGSNLQTSLSVLIQRTFLDELRAFLWLKPFLNGGTRDGGWSCRDHAVVLGALLTLDGHQVAVRHGRCMFVQGATSGHPPTGYGQETPGTGHSWLAVGGVDVDLSPQLGVEIGRWRPVRSLGVIGGSWLVDGQAHEALLTGTQREYDREVAIATNLEDEMRAVYLAESEEPFAPSMLTFEYVNSPLTDQLRRTTGGLAYAKLSLHLDEVRRGGRTLGEKGTKKAWRLVDRRSDADGEELCSRLDAAVTLQRQTLGDASSH